MGLNAETLSQRMARSQRLAARFAAAECVKDVAEATISEARRELGAVSATFYEVSHPPRVYRLISSHGLAEDAMVRLRELPIATPLPLFEAIRSGRVVWYANHEELLAKYPHMKISATPRQLFEGCICIPLLVGENTIGGLSLGFDEPRAVNERDAALIVELGTQASLALERCRQAVTIQVPEGGPSDRALKRIEREVARSVAAVSMARGVVGAFEQVKGAGDMLDAARNSSIAAGILADIAHALATLKDGASPEHASAVISIALDAMAVAAQQCAETSLGLTSAITEIADEGESNKPAVPDH